MAEKKKKAVKREEPEKVSESSKNKEKQPEPVKPYIHIDTFLQTATALYNLNRMQVAGFKARMNGRQYQTDEQVFLQELKKYLNLD